MVAIANSNLLYLSLVLLSLLALYLPILQDLVPEWLNNDNYSHGFFIPLISVYMIWSMREELRKLPLEPCNWGVIWVILGLSQLALGYAGSEFFLKRSSLIIVLLGSIIFLFGMQYFRILLVPVMYLIFMIPLPAIIWNKIAFQLQLFSSSLAEHVVQFLGMSILRNGNILYLPSTTLEVVDACSGLRSLMTMFTLSTFLAWQSDINLTKKWILVSSAIPIAIISNAIRLTATAILASFYGERVAQGFLHEFSGFVTFVLGTVLLIVVNYMLGLSQKRVPCH